jgi:hypothetical protein
MAERLAIRLVLRGGRRSHTRLRRGCRLVFPPSAVVLLMHAASVFLCAVYMRLTFSNTPSAVVLDGVPAATDKLNFMRFIVALSSVCKR